MTSIVTDEGILVPHFPHRDRVSMNVLGLVLILSIDVEELVLFSEKGQKIREKIILGKILDFYPIFCLSPSVN